MRYRRFGKLDFQVSALGFGCMRFPTKGSYDRIDEPEATRMLRHAIDHGVNYLDTAWPYHGGNSELVVGRALQEGYREKVALATKLPIWALESAEDVDRILDRQLEKLQTDHIDFYLLHALNKKNWKTAQDLSVIDWAERARADGRIRHLGFSFHDGYEVFKEIVDAHDRWDFCQIQYNYMNEHTQAGTRGLEYAASKGLAVVIMEPLLGGKLANPPQAVQELWDALPTDRSPVEWAFQWLWDKPQASVVLSGMSTMEQVRQNVQSADRSAVGQLTQDEFAVIDQVRQKYEALTPIGCTDCRYCLPCTVGLNIPNLFRMLNEGVLYDQLEQARERYSKMPEDQRASACIQCRECEERCPQGIEISEKMTLVHEVLGEGQPVSFSA